MSWQTPVSNIRISIVLILQQGNVALPLILCCSFFSPCPLVTHFLSCYGPWNWTLVSYFTIVPPSHLSGWSCSALLPILAAHPLLCCHRCPCHPQRFSVCTHPDLSCIPNVATALTTVLHHCILLCLCHYSSPAWSWPTCHLFCHRLPLFFPMVSPTSSMYLCQWSKFSYGYICTLYNVYNLYNTTGIPHHPSPILLCTSYPPFYPSLPSFPLHSK